MKSVIQYYPSTKSLQNYSVNGLHKPIEFRSRKGATRKLQCRYGMVKGSACHGNSQPVKPNSDGDARRCISPVGGWPYSRWGLKIYRPKLQPSCAAGSPQLSTTLRAHNPRCQDPNAKLPPPYALDRRGVRNKCIISFGTTYDFLSCRRLKES